MKTVEFISQLQSLDVKLFLQAGELKCNAPQGVMTPDIISELKNQKQAIIDFLQSLEAAKDQQEIVISKRPEQASAPMSYAQQRLWLLQQIDQHSTAYNGLSAYNLKGDFNILACQNAWQQIISRHEVLRTNFVERDEKLIQLIKPAELFEVNQQKCTNEQLPVLLNEMANTVFNLQNDALITVDMIALSPQAPQAPQEHVMVVNMHHIISDGWSVSILIDEFTRLYDGFVKNLDVDLAPVDIQYGDFAHWQRENLTQSALQKQLDFWQNNLKDSPALIELATDFARPAEQTYRGDTFEFTLDKMRYEKVKQLAEQTDSTVFMVMLSAYNILLSGHSSKQDIVVGTPIANRVSVDLEKTIGMFMNTLVLRNQLDNSQSFASHLDSVRNNTFAAFEHQDLPFEQLVDVLNPQRSLSFSPLFQVMFILQNTPSSVASLEGLTMSELKRADHTAKYDLSLEVTESADSCHCVFEYSTDLFKTSTVEMLRDHWLQILDFACATPNADLSTLSMLTDAEKQQFNQWNDTTVEYDRHTPIHQLIDQQAQNIPDQVASAFEAQELSYSQLTAKANQLAHYLIESGVNKGDLIGVGINRSNDMLIAVLAIMKAGAAYVPMDPTYPPDRIAYMADDAKVKFIISEGNTAASLFDGRDNVLLIDQINTTIFDSASPDVHLDSHDLAYVIYTSGSTGKPKGVMVEHGNVVNFLIAMQKEFDLTSGCWMALTSLSFDISVLELLSTLASGMKVVIA
ncbi:MAG: AMP-binding protein, partial [Algicola sp.]|nr:AMP-binding protein [Algicola sp.]